MLATLRAIPLPFGIAGAPMPITIAISVCTPKARQNACARAMRSTSSGPSSATGGRARAASHPRCRTPRARTGHGGSQRSRPGVRGTRIGDQDRARRAARRPGPLATVGRAARASPRDSRPCTRTRSPAPRSCTSRASASAGVSRRGEAGEKVDRAGPRRHRGPAACAAPRWRRAPVLRGPRAARRRRARADAEHRGRGR